MISDEVAADDNAELGAGPPPSESLAPMARSDERPKGVVLNWTNFFLVQRSPSAANPDAIERLVAVAASQAGLAHFEDLDDVGRIWFVRLTKEAVLQTDQVMHLRYWKLIPDHDGPYLTALLCESGALFIVDAEDVYEVDEMTRRWFAKSKAERGRSPSEHASTSQRASEQAEHG